MSNKKGLKRTNITKSKKRKISNKKQIVADVVGIGGLIGIGAFSALFVGTNLNSAKQIDKNHDKDDLYTQGDAEQFDVDLEIIKKYKDRLTRLANNGDEPIYVTISDSFSKEEQELIQSALDYYERLFEDINPSYRFKIVDSNVLRNITGKTSIDFMKGKTFTKMGGVVEGTAKSRRHAFRNNYIIDGKITLRENEEFSGINEYVIMHELAHLFGFADVYVDQMFEHKYETMMHTMFNINAMNQLTPGDYALLHALYNENIRENGKIKTDKLKEITDLVEIYTKNYYDARSELYKAMSEFEIKELDEEELVGKTFDFQNSIYTPPPVHAIHSFDIEITFKDGQYFYNVKNEDGLKVASVKGEYSIHNGMVFLHGLRARDEYFYEQTRSGYESYMKTSTQVLFLKGIKGDYSTRYNPKIMDNYELLNKYKEPFSGKEAEVDKMASQLKEEFFNLVKEYKAQKVDNINTFATEDKEYTFKVKMDKENNDLGLFI